MKKILLLTTLTISFFVHGQSIFPNRMRWIVRYEADGFSDASHFRVYENFIDSVMNGTEYCHLKEHIGTKFTKITYEVKDKRVFITDKTHFYTTPSPLFDFNLKKQDRLWYYTVDSISEINVYGKKLIMQHMKGGTFIVQGFGNLTSGFAYFDEVWNTTSFHYHNCIRFCFGDSAFTYQNLSGKPILTFLGTPCMNDSFAKKVEVFNFPTIASPSIYPNPAKDEIYIDGFKGVLKLYDFTGRLLYECLIEKTMNINIANFPSGILYVHLINENGRRYFPTEKSHIS